MTDVRVKVNGHLRVKVDKQGVAGVALLVDTSRATPDRPRRLGMEHPEAAAEVEVDLGEVLSRQQQR